MKLCVANYVRYIHKLGEPGAVKRVAHLVIVISVKGENVMNKLF